LTTAPLPAGTVEAPGGWALFDNKFRVFHGADRAVRNVAEETIAEVSTEGVQLLDGSISDEYPPSIHVYICSDGGITADQARALASALVEAADEIDGWDGK
jgi:hypothetical protein